MIKMWNKKILYCGVREVGAKKWNETTELRNRWKTHNNVRLFLKGTVIWLNLASPPQSAKYGRGRGLQLTSNNWRLYILMYWILIQRQRKFKSYILSIYLSIMYLLYLPYSYTLFSIHIKTLISFILPRTSFLWPSSSSSSSSMSS